MLVFNIIKHDYPMKWDILVVGGKETNRYFASTGEGTQMRSFRNWCICEAHVGHVTKEGDSPVFTMKISFLSIALNVNSCLKIAVPSAKPKYILSNR